MAVDTIPVEIAVQRASRADSSIQQTGWWTFTRCIEVIVLAI